MGSTARTENHRGLVLARLAVAWDKRPSLSLGELLARALASSTLASLDGAEGLARLEAFDDGYLAEVVERYVGLGLDEDPEAGNDYCNGAVAPTQVSGGACLIDALHVDDVAAILAEKGLDKRPAGK